MSEAITQVPGYWPEGQRVQTPQGITAKLSLLGPYPFLLQGCCTMSDHVLWPQFHNNLYRKSFHSALMYMYMYTALLLLWFFKAYTVQLLSSNNWGLGVHCVHIFNCSQNLDYIRHALINKGEGTLRNTDKEQNENVAHEETKWSYQRHTGNTKALQTKQNQQEADWGRLQKGGIKRRVKNRRCSTGSAVRDDKLR